MPRSREPDVARLYHLHSSNVRRRLPEMSVDEDRRPQRFRTYAGSRRVDLPGRDFSFSMPLDAVLRGRRSVREYLLRPLDLALLGQLLHASYGLRGYRQVEGQSTVDRFTPSAGGLYPLELYVAAQMVEGLADGVYHYDARAHQLELRRTGVVHPELARMTIGQELIRDANVVILISAIFERTMWKYGQRGYRYVWLDAGHVGQNVYLCAAALGLGAVAIGGFYDAELHALLRLPRGEEDVVYLVCVGQLPEE